MESYAKGETAPVLLERTAAAHADREALVEVASGRRWTWAELDRDVDALARGLMSAGLGKGDRVGIWAPSRWAPRRTSSSSGGARRPRGQRDWPS